MKFKRALALLLSLAVVAGISGCASGGGSNGASASGNSGKSNVKIKIANIYGADTYESKSLVKFKEIVESKADNIAVEVYTNAQLGNEETLTDSVRQGSVEVVVVGPMIAQYVPLIACSEYPYLVDTWEQANAVLRNENFQKMTTDGIDAQGIDFLGYSPVGFRVISSSFPIKTIDDIKGMRLRAPNIPYYIKMAECWNANVITMSISELFTGLEQKVVDGQENPYNVVIANKFYEVQPYIIDTRHMFSTHGWYANKKFMDGLSEDDKKVVTESIEEAIDYCWKISQEGEDSEKKYLEENGVTITPCDDKMREEMKATQGPMTEWFFNEYKGADKVLEEVEKIKASL